MKHIATAACVALALVAPTVTATAMAAETGTTDAPAKPYVTATVLGHEDGTGHGTAAQTFITRANGYPVGDDTPTDGVVSSGDTVHYRVALEFKAAKARVVTVGFDTANVPYLAPHAATCPTGHAVSATVNGGACRYTVPAGVAERLVADLTMTAKDTAGRTVRGQKPRLSIVRGDGATERVELGVLTVVSDANADVVVDNGAWEGDEAIQYGTLDASFRLRTVTLRRPGYSTTHGSSRLVPWGADVDVSAWPDGTVWSLDGSRVESDGGMLRLRDLTGDHTLKAHNDTHPQSGEGLRTYDLHVKVTADSFNGKGQPGDGGDRLKDTADATLGSDSGRPYPNNDWSRWRVDPDRDDMKTVTTGDSMSLIYPDDPSYTRYDEANRRLGGRTSTVNVYRIKSEDKTRLTVGEDTDLQAVIELDDGSPKDGETYSWWKWGDGLQYAGGLTAPAGGEGRYTVRWTTNPNADTSKPDGADWTDAKPADRDIRGILITHDATLGGVFRFDMHAGSDGVTTITGVGSKRLIHEADVIRTMPGVWGVSIAHDGGGTVDAGKEAKVSFTPQVTGIPGRNMPIHATGILCLPVGAAGLKPDAPGWTVATVRADGCAKAYRLALDDTDNPNVRNDGTNATRILPVIRLAGRARLTASGPQNPSLDLTVSADEYMGVKAATVERTDTADLTVRALDGYTTSVTANQTLVDPKSTVSYEWSIYNRGVDATGATRTVIRLPQDGDMAMTTSDGDRYQSDNKGLDGSWHEYTLGASTVTGTLTGPAETDDADGTGTTVLYSTSDKYSINPTDYTWRTWGDIPEAERPNIHALLVIADTADGLSASRGTFTVSLAGGGMANVYIGGSRIGDKALSTMPFPAQSHAKWATLSGNMFYDANGNGIRDDGETLPLDLRYPRLTLYKDGEKVSTSPSTKTGGAFSYRYLTSGDYRLEFSSYQPDKPASSDTLGYATDYYGVRQTPRITTKGGASLTVHLNVGGVSTGNDFGYWMRDPKASVRQSVDKKCKDASCTVTWTTTVRNDGNTDLKSGESILHTRVNTTAPVSSTISTSTGVRFVQMVDNDSTSLGLRYALDEKGRVWYATDCDSTCTTSQWKHAVALDDYPMAYITGADNQCLYGVDTRGRLLIASTKSITGHGESFYLVGEKTEIAPGVWQKNTPEGETVKRVYQTGQQNDYVDGSLRRANLYILTESGHLYEELYDSTATVTTWRRVGTADGTSPDLASVGLLNYGELYGVTSDGKAYILRLDYRSCYSDAALLPAKYEHLTQCQSDADAFNILQPVSLQGRNAPTGGIKAIRVSVGYTGDKRFATYVLDANGDVWYQEVKGDERTSSFASATWRKLPFATPIASFGDQSAGPRYAIDDYSHAHPLYALGADGRAYAWLSDEVDTGDDRQAFPEGGLKPGVNTLFDGEPIRFLEYDNEWTSHESGTAITGSGRMLHWTRRQYATDITPSERATGDTADIDPVATDTRDGWTYLDYRAPRDMATGDELTITQTAVIPRGKADTVAALQAWYDSTDEPYRATPVYRDGKLTRDPDKTDTPALPDTSKLSASTGMVTGNPTCIVTGDNGSNDAHDFTSGYYWRTDGTTPIGPEDGCEQSGAAIPAADTPLTGTVAGRVWVDTDKDGLQGNGEPARQGVTVTLYDGNGDRLGTAVTDGSGRYSFTGLAEGRYMVRFTKPTLGRWTTPDRGDTNPERDRSDTDSDASIDRDDYGRATADITVDADRTDWLHVDAGVVDEPLLTGLPTTGRAALLIAAITLLAVLLAVGYRLTRRG